MFKRRIIWLLIAGVVLAGVLVMVLAHEREPEYGGKKLSEWVLRYYRGPPREVDSEAAQAIRQIGSNAVPYLLEWIRYETPPWKTKLYRVHNPVIRRFKTGWKLTDEKQIEKREAAEDALVELGPKADCALRELFEMLAGSEASTFRAVVILDRLGKAGLPPVAGALTNKSFTATDRSDLGHFFAALGTNGWPLVPVLTALLKDPDQSVRDAATKAIQGIDPAALEKARGQ